MPFVKNPFWTICLVSMWSKKPSPGGGEGFSVFCTQNQGLGFEGADKFSAALRQFESLFPFPLVPAASFAAS